MTTFEDGAEQERLAFMLASWIRETTDLLVTKFDVLEGLGCLGLALVEDPESRATAGFVAAQGFSKAVR